MSCGHVWDKKLSVSWLDRPAQGRIWSRCRAIYCKAPFSPLLPAMIVLCPRSCSVQLPFAPPAGLAASLRSRACAIIGAEALLAYHTAQADQAGLCSLDASNVHNAVHYCHHSANAEQKQNCLECSAKTLVGKGSVGSGAAVRLSQISFCLAEPQAHTAQALTSVRGKDAGHEYKMPHCMLCYSWNDSCGTSSSVRLIERQGGLSKVRWYGTRWCIDYSL